MRWNEQEAGEEDDQHDGVHRHLVGEIDEAEQLAARHRLDAVLAAGELRLQGEEEHHLRQRQRDHREIDALAADRERAGDEAEHRGGRGAGEDREFRREAPGLGGIGGQIARPAEIERMAERQQPDIADQQVEGAGEQRKAQRLHQEQRIDEERRDHERHHHDGERDRARSRRARRGGMPALRDRRALSAMSGRPSEQAGRADQQHDRHDDEDHGVGGFRERTPWSGPR